MIRKNIARAALAAAAGGALVLGLAGTASAAGDARLGDNEGVNQGCVNSGLTLLGCTQVVDVLNGLDVLSHLVETEDVTVQVPVVDSEAVDLDD